MMESTNLHAERLTSADLPAVAEIERLCFAEPWSERSLEFLLTDAAVAFAVHSNGSPIAYGGMLLAPGEGQITNIAVHPGFRRLGAGRIVLQALLAEATSLRLEQVCLEVRESNLPASALYLGAGFQPVGIRKRFYKNPSEDAIVMVKTLG